MYIRATVLFITFFKYSSGFILYHCVYGCMFCMLMFYFVNYGFWLLLSILLLLCFVFLLLCYMFFVSVSIIVMYLFLLLCTRMFRSVYPVSLCCSLYCLGVNVYFTTATRCQPNCSEIYIISYDTYTWVSAWRAITALIIRFSVRLLSGGCFCVLLLRSAVRNASDIYKWGLCRSAFSARFLQWNWKTAAS
jgi:hypothetical protein